MIIEKALREALKQFTPAELKAVRATEAELHAAWLQIAENSAEKLRERLARAELGYLPDGSQISPSDTAARLENTRAAREALAAGPTLVAAARDIEEQAFRALQAPGRKVAEGALEFLESTLKNPPTIEVPRVLSEWGIGADLVAIFKAALRRAADDIHYDLAQWPRASADAGFGWLRRAGVFPSRE